MYEDEDNPVLRQLERFGEERRAFWADPPRGVCKDPAGCITDLQIVYPGADEIERCAHHHTRTLRRRMEDGYPCDHCGNGPAFRDPEHRRDEYLCPDCHKKYDAYEPGERAMVNQTRVRMGVVHSQGQKAVCIAAGHGTDCHGQIKQRGKVGVLCDFHADPRGWLRARQP